MLAITAFASLALSIFSLILVLKRRRPYAADLSEFRTETARLIAEFNRIVERDVGLLDDRLALSQQETRRSRKAEEALKKLLEEARLEGLLEGITEDDFPKTEEPEPLGLLPHPKEAYAYSKEEPPQREEPADENGLFEGFAVSRLKNYARHRNQPQKKHELLLQYLKEKKNREELLEMGFSPNEINLAMLSLSSGQEEEH